MSWKPRNIKFYDKVKAFVFSSFDLLTSNLNKGILRPNNMKDIQELPETMTVSAFMQSDPVISKHIDCELSFGECLVVNFSDSVYLGAINS